MRWRPGAVIDCEAKDMIALPNMVLYDKEFIESLRAESAFVDTRCPIYIRPIQTPFLYAPKKGWSTYEWVGFWNYTVLVTATVLGCWILHLLRLL